MIGRIGTSSGFETRVLSKTAQEDQIALHLCMLLCPSGKRTLFKGKRIREILTADECGDKLLDFIAMLP